MLKLILNKKNKEVSIKDYYFRRNKLLIKRKAGGFGDIVMQRMMIEDFAKTNLEIFYACPSGYLDIMKDHPYLKEAKDLTSIKDEEYGIIYDITTICAVTESALKEKNKNNRSDIWANYCGIKLENHETYLRSNEEDLKFWRDELQKINPSNKKIIFMSTRSANNDMGHAKSLNDNQVKEIVEKIESYGFLVVTANKNFQEIYSSLGVKQFINLKIKHWIALIDACDLTISVDTAAFHIAGALKKPLVGVFGFTDGKLYGKYYDFILVQKHRDNGNWPCGPCYNYSVCPKEINNIKKPCITDLTSSEIFEAFKSALGKWNL